MLLQSISEWQPFRIDALGLVTLFGAEEMSIAVGRLVGGWVTEWLPILGAYTIANDQIRRPCPGFVLYSITDGIVATDVCCWFARWLMTYPITYSATTITISMNMKPSPVAHNIISALFGALVTLPLLILAIVMEDFWGIANVVSMMVSVIVRHCVVAQLRGTIDEAVQNLSNDPGSQVKIFVTLPSGSAVTIFAPRQIVTNCLLTDPRPKRKTMFMALRMLAWAAFGVHAITLGMSTLISQILCVVVLVSSTVLVAKQVGDRPSFIGTKLAFDIDLGDSTWSRTNTYVRLGLSEVEEEYMLSWGLFPQRGNKAWWDRYCKRKKSMKTSKEARTTAQTTAAIAPAQPPSNVANMP